MGAVVVIGEPGLVDGYALAGAVVVPAEGPDQARRAWRDLPESVSLVILTDSAAQALTADIRDSAVLTVVMPA
ncbi:V-type ATP synthase subunit F [Mycobacterium sp. Y57]|uniref:V-type ATP synthase subunit F n=1 Tax=Mycolicibacterium xanthum TaxID=2796469 RepID=UPI001C8414EC|nr:V-type ATP synthase subunit F [Mycolicibacterium xanthum]MBX7431086.1 V-type ATP synthase subunit F [Mycolicibacterium xanthum]